MSIKDKILWKTMLEDHFGNKIEERRFGEGKRVVTTDKNIINVSEGDIGNAIEELREQCEGTRAVTRTAIVQERLPIQLISLKKQQEKERVERERMEKEEKSVATEILNHSEEVETIENNEEPSVESKLEETNKIIEPKLSAAERELERIERMQKINYSYYGNPFGHWALDASQEEMDKLYSEENERIKNLKEIIQKEKECQDLSESGMTNEQNAKQHEIVDNTSEEL